MATLNNCEILNFSIVTSINPKYYCSRLSYTIRKYCFNKLKIEKANFFTQSSPKFLTLAFSMLEDAWQVAYLLGHFWSQTLNNLVAYKKTCKN